MSNLVLPGLFGPSSQKSTLDSLSGDCAVRLVANALADAATCIAHVADRSELDQGVTSDIRYRLALSQAMTMAITITDETRRRAWRRCIELTSALQRHGNGGVPGLLAQAALTLGRAVQNNDREKLAQVLDLLHEALRQRAAILKLSPATYTAAGQMNFLSRLNR